AEKRGRAHWRVAATLIGAVALAGGVLAASRGSWLAALALIGSGLYLCWSSRLRPVVRSEPISEDEARSVLAVSRQATRAEIQAAWKKAMARAHPDQGGTEGLAQRVNAARERLLKGAPKH
ncbi:hypothetical protein LTR94_027327, partial [Friedmanniomyces endolithicus]